VITCSSKGYRCYGDSLSADQRRCEEQEGWFKILQEGADGPNRDRVVQKCKLGIENGGDLLLPKKTQMLRCLSLFNEEEMAEVSSETVWRFLESVAWDTCDLRACMECTVVLSGLPKDMLMPQLFGSVVVPVLIRYSEGDEDCSAVENRLRVLHWKEVLVSPERGVSPLKKVLKSVSPASVAILNSRRVSTLLLILGCFDVLGGQGESPKSDCHSEWLNLSSCLFLRLNALRSERGCNNGDLVVGLRSATCLYVESSFQFNCEEGTSFSRAFSCLFLHLGMSDMEVKWYEFVLYSLRAIGDKDLLGMFQPHEWTLIRSGLGYLMRRLNHKLRKECFSDVSIGHRCYFDLTCLEHILLKIPEGKYFFDPNQKGSDKILLKEVVTAMWSRAKNIGKNVSFPTLQQHGLLDVAP